jgi:hypothetical protein
MASKRVVGVEVMGENLRLALTASTPQRFIIAVAAGRWVYQRVSVSKAPPPPASPEEAAKELEAYYGYPVKPPARR